MVVVDIDFPCGRYGFLLWPISSCCGRYGCGRYGLWPIWSHPPDSKQREQILEEQYEELLCLEDGSRLPDPFTMDDEMWIGEKLGMKHWPPTMIQDISVLVQLHDTVVDKASLCKRLLCDYKDQQAFSYFCSGFLFALNYCDISAS